VGLSGGRDAHRDGSVSDGLGHADRARFALGRRYGRAQEEEGNGSSRQRSGDQVHERLLRRRVSDSPYTAEQGKPFSPAPPFAETWIDVATRLHRLLAALGASRDLSEDLAQETAARVIASEVPFDSSDDLYRWCATVARNLLIDHHRRNRYLDLEASIPEVTDASDAESRFLGRERIRAAAALLNSLGDHDQRLLTARRAVGEPMSNAETVRRHRLRSRLHAAITAAGAWCGCATARRLGPRDPISKIGISTSVVHALAATSTVLIGLSGANETSDLASGTESLAGVQYESLDVPWSVATTNLAAVPTPVRLPSPPEDVHRVIPVVEVATPAVGATTSVDEGSHEDAIICVAGNPEVEDWCWGWASWPPKAPGVPTVPQQRLAPIP
jgi:DNA-directed RNA polymerase specialized sigma24 family protein